jgi:hypothetical protein
LAGKGWAGKGWAGDGWAGDGWGAAARAGLGSVAMRIRVFTRPENTTFCPLSYISRLSASMVPPVKCTLTGSAVRTLPALNSMSAERIRTS